jgi:hypothetical protein
MITVEEATEEVLVLPIAIITVEEGMAQTTKGLSNKNSARRTIIPMPNIAYRSS